MDGAGGAAEEGLARGGEQGGVGLPVAMGVEQWLLLVVVVLL